jgi:Flp pilus assembly protein TadD
VLAMMLASAVNGQTFNEDIAPILQSYCTSCHRPGEAAPFSLLEYREAKTHARQIAEATRKRIMPPWKPSPGRGDFEGELRLSSKQIELIEAWAAKGAPQGAGTPRTSSPNIVSGWRLGAPDLVISLDRAYTLPASGEDVFRNFVLPASVNQKRYVRAVEIRPGPKSVVHHANVLIDRKRTLRRREGKDGSPGFAGMDVQIESQTFDPDSHFLFWKPGTTVLQEPEDMAWQLDPGTDLILNVHMRPSGKAETIQPSVGLYFTDKPPDKRPMLLQLEHDGAIDIPPGRSDFVVTDTLKLPADVDVLAVYPHGHYLARDMQAFATLPDGSVRWLIHIADWDLNWQAVYRYKSPVSLPKASVVTMRYTYDNSETNLRNPSHPPVRVVAGDRSVDEMAHFWMQVLPRAAGEVKARRALQRASMIRRLEKYPTDFEAHYSLGSLCQEEGDLASAAIHYRSALHNQKGNPAAHNALGSVLLEQERNREAEAEFRAAIEVDIDYADAHYNLARLLLAREELGPAIRHLQEVIRIEPDDAPALSDLGAAISMTGRVEQGLAYLRKAVQLRPDLFLGRYNLALALMAADRVVEARAEFKAALQLKPGDDDVLQALERLRGR